MRREVLMKVIEYENKFPVENYRTYDWNVWPLLRITTAFNALVPVSKRANPRCTLTRLFRYQTLESIPLARDIYHAASGIILKNRLERSLASDSGKNSSLLSAGKDIILLTLSGRRQKHQGCLYEIYTDPLVDLFRKKGMKTVVWEKGEELAPRCHPSAWISRQLQIELLKERPLKHLKEPSWFTDFAVLYHSTTNIPISWPECEKWIQSVQNHSRVFEKWLLRTEARLLIAVCWYDPVNMAATLAARRLGIPCVDLQHGLQDSDHFAYSGWMKAPSRPYELVPDFFWSWGTKEAKRLVASNPAFKSQSKTIVGGNLWYNLWRENGDFCSRLPDKTFKGRLRKKTILVSLQHGPANFADLLFTVIKTCSDDWFWLIRMHPATPLHEAKYIRDSLNEIDRENVDYEISSSTKLYILFGNCDVHITGHSTSALEALGFGVPTITATEAGVAAFKEYIEYGVIMAATTCDEIKHAINNFTRISGDKCRESVNKVFALNAEASQGISELLSAANIPG